MSTDTPPTVHEAELASGASGGVVRGAELTDAQAVERRKRGLNVVVCGADRKANRRKAAGIESLVGAPYKPHAPHPKAGPQALPHYQQASGDPPGPTFYEVGARRARRTPP